MAVTRAPWRVLTSKARPCAAVGHQTTRSALGNHLLVMKNKGNIPKDHSGGSVRGPRGGCCSPSLAQLGTAKVLSLRGEGERGAAPRRQQDRAAPACEGLPTALSLSGACRNQSKHLEDAAFAEGTCFCCAGENPTNQPGQRLLLCPRGAEVTGSFMNLRSLRRVWWRSQGAE